MRSGPFGRRRNAKSPRFGRYIRARPRMARSRSRVTERAGSALGAEGAGRLMSGLRRASSAQHRGDGPQEDLEVKGQRPVLDVVEVQLQPLREGQVAASGD